jgi:hypothetical protein
MRDNESDVLLALKLRKLKADIKEEIYTHIIVGELCDTIKTYIEDKWNRTLKVVVFGSYEDGGEELLLEIAQKIARRGFIGITGSGFFLPSKPDTFHELAELFPEVANWFFESKKSQFYLFRCLLPYIGDFAVDKLYPIRTNAYELEGCFEYKKPVMGFICDGRVTQEDKECSFLEFDTSKNGLGKECKANDETDCKENYHTNLHCPFYHIINIPLVQKIWFLTIKEWKLIAVNKLEKLEDYLDKFLPN